MNSPKPFHLLFGSFFAMSAVVLGALGAHALEEKISAEQLESFETAVRYQMYHALVLVMIALKGHHFHLRYERTMTTLFGAGIVLFCGSIYGLSLQDLFDVNLRWLGPVTPFGGLVLITAWVLMLLDAAQLIARPKK